MFNIYICSTLISKTSLLKEFEKKEIFFLKLEQVNFKMIFIFIAPPGKFRHSLSIRV